jgi:AcrR family transcriptional regulator
LLDAAEKCFAEHGVGRSTIGQIASVAKVTRPTVYKYFEGRDELVRAVFLRSAERTVDSIRIEVDDAANIGDIIIEAILFSLRKATEEPHFREIFDTDAGIGTLQSVLGNDDFIVIAVERFLEPLIQPVREAGLLRDDFDPYAFTEWCCRILFSIRVVKSVRTQTEEDVRTMIRGLLLPQILK